jgi:hypothetical protein
MRNAAEAAVGGGSESAATAIGYAIQATAKDLVLRFDQEVAFVRYTEELGRAVVGVRCADLLHAVTMDSPGFESIAESPAARA